MSTWVIVTSLTLPMGMAPQPEVRADHHLIALEFRGPDVAFAEHPLRCGTDHASRDMLWGVVEAGDSTDVDAVVYEGVLQRVTEQTLCGADIPSRTPRAAVTPPCRATLSGAADVKVRIKVYRRDSALQGAWIVLTPIEAMARVTGNYRRAELREMQRAYDERTTIEIPTPPDRLVPGRYPAYRPPGGHGRWVLVVVPSSSAGPSS